MKEQLAQGNKITATTLQGRALWARLGRAVQKATSDGTITEDVAHRWAHNGSNLFADYCDKGGDLGRVMVEESQENVQARENEDLWKPLTRDQIIFHLTNGKDSPAAVVSVDKFIAQQLERGTEAIVGFLICFHIVIVYTYIIL